MTLIEKHAGWIALVILAILAVSGGFYAKQVATTTQNDTHPLGSTACGGITCLSGGLRLVSDAGGDFEADVASIFAGAVSMTSSFTVGSNGTAFTRINGGLCNIKSAVATLAASTSVAVDCGGGALGATALTGVTAGDRVFLQQSTTTPSISAGAGTGLTILGVSASSTSGFITAILFNGTGGTFTWTTAASSSWQYYVTK